jgi:hypothetical protein
MVDNLLELSGGFGTALEPRTMQENTGERKPEHGNRRVSGL